MFSVMCYSPWTKYIKRDPSDFEALDNTNIQSLWPNHQQGQQISTRLCGNTNIEWAGCISITHRSSAARRSKSRAIPPIEARIKHGFTCSPFSSICTALYKISSILPSRVCQKATKLAVRATAMASFLPQPRRSVDGGRGSLLFCSSSPGNRRRRFTSHHVTPTMASVCLVRG